MLMNAFKRHIRQVAHCLGIIVPQKCTAHLQGCRVFHPAGKRNHCWQLLQDEPDGAGVCWRSDRCAYDPVSSYYQGVALTLEDLMSAKGQAAFFEQHVCDVARCSWHTLASAISLCPASPPDSSRPATCKSMGPVSLGLGGTASLWD